MPKFRLFGSTAPKPVSFPVALDINGESISFELTVPPESRGVSRQGDDLVFALPDDRPVYLVQPGNNRGFQSPQNTFIPLPAGDSLRASVSLAPLAGSVNLYLFLCDEAGAPLVRKALKPAGGDVITFTRPKGAAKAFVAVRLADDGRLGPLTLSVAPATSGNLPKPDISPFFTAAVQTLARNGQDDLLMDYLAAAVKSEGRTNRARYLGAAANEAARAKRFGAEARCLERLNDMAPSNGLQQKIARAYHRDARYESLAETLTRWPHVLETHSRSPFDTGAQEIRAAAALAEHLRTPHAERYQSLTASPRAAYLLHNALPYASGGYATRGHGLMRGLIAAGGAGSVLARPGFPSDTKPDSGAPPGASRRRIDGVTYRFENSFGRPGQLYRYIRDAGDYFAEAAPRGVTVIQAASNFYTGLAGAYAAVLRKRPFIYEVRGFWELTRESRDPAFAQTPLYRRNRRLEQSCAHLADHVLTLTSSMKREIESWGVPPERVTLAPNAVDPDIFTPVPRDARLGAKLGLTPDNLVIGYVGSFVDYEGLDMMVEASLRLMARDARVRLMIVGDDTPGGKAAVPVGVQLRAQVEASGMADRVLFPGRVPHEDVPAYYSLIDICPFPRRPVPVCEMVSPMKPLEAMAMSKCVIVSSVGGMEGMVRNDETGLIFRKGDVNALHAALRKALDPDLRRRLGAQARDWVRRERSWNTIGASVADLHGAVTSGEAGFRHHPDAYDKAIKRFSKAFPILPVIEAAGDALKAPMAEVAPDDADAQSPAG